MATSTARASSRKAAKRLKSLARAARILSAKKAGKPLIPDRVLRLLAAAELPAQKKAYQLKLRELLGE
jgi:hypothetical protein